MDYTEVNYWDELLRDHGVDKNERTFDVPHMLGRTGGALLPLRNRKAPAARKLSGVYSHRVVHKNPMLLRGFDDEFFVPHSRHTTVDIEDVKKHPEIKILAVSDKAGLYAAATDEGRQIFITGHSEYDKNTLSDEYFRDKAAGMNPHIPENYFPDDDVTREPVVKWRSHANLIYSNWLNYFVYQNTPYDITAIK